MDQRVWLEGAFVDELAGDEGPDVIIGDGEEALDIVAVPSENLVMDDEDIYGVSGLHEIGRTGDRTRLVVVTRLHGKVVLTCAPYNIDPEPGL